jgi:branched-chain amino acid transport system ATP-binding protein
VSKLDPNVEAPAAAEEGASLGGDVLALEIDHVNAGYGRTEVLHDVTLKVPQGSAVALVGPNGAGKTSLLRVSAGLIKPMSGRVLLAGKDVSTMDVHDRTNLGLCDIPEGRGIFPSLTVRENLILSSQKRHQKEAIAQAIELFPVLGSRLRLPAGSLSGGEQQMLAVTRAYLSNPSIVLFDELSLGLAPLIIDQLYDYIKLILQAGVSVLIVEQYVNRVLDFADAVYLLDRGSVVLSGPADEVREKDLFAHYMGIEAE